ncbi:RNA polymerase sigma-70 factor [Luteimonas sp. RD2P54]|uniref:RNA polymerase sigma-70 factor n=1 Tax=Luteimonas endophytica TaxID=3042023 RepID=A0ABT6J482_9GAMM|nr:RNA polymerase sigma-70 factor [Luteimonas endophytica]MDH5821631.1 RNA polymerase sigma-70 factor [Luteimonas endophytica]
MTPHDHTFETHRPRLLALAYRMLGSRADAEDTVQDAWLRWRQADPAAVRDPAGWLVATVTRLGIDRLRLARTARTDYVGPWLPEPLTIDDSPGPAGRAELAEQISLAFLALLERLGPEERAAFLLREVFDYDYAHIAAMLGHGEANCRQMVHRARERLQAGRARFPGVAPERHRELLARFLEASASGDREAIVGLLHADARLLSDGGGKAVAALRPLEGAERIARLYWAVARRVPAEAQWRIGRVNGEAAGLRFLHGQLQMITTIVSDGDRIVEVLNQMNPDKLRLH